MELITSLEESFKETVKYFDLAPDQLNKTYAKDKWSIKELLHHLVDAEVVLNERIKRIISEEKPVLWGFDPNGRNKHLNHNKSDFTIEKSVYIAMRAVTIQLVKDHYESNGLREFVHNETGLRTLKDEMEKVAFHNNHHLTQIKKALDQ